jgi:hypothetical protein
VQAFVARRELMGAELVVVRSLATRPSDKPTPMGAAAGREMASPRLDDVTRLGAEGILTLGCTTWAARAVAT